MTHPTSIAVAPGAGVLLQDQPAGLVSPWGAKDVQASDPAPALFPGRTDWTTTNASIVAPEYLLSVFNSCRACSLEGIEATPTQPMLSSIAYEGDVSGADLAGATLLGTLNGWNLSGANLTDATFEGASLAGAVLDHTVVDRTVFDGVDLRGATLTALRYRAPPSFAGVKIGPFGGKCTAFKDTALVNARLTPVKPDPGCETSPLLPGSTVGLDLLDLLVRQEHANVDLDGAAFVADASDRALFAGADLRGVNLTGASFVGFPVDFLNTNFDGASLERTNFELADLSGATFQNVKAAGASFEDASLGGASFAGSQTNLQGADFVRADLTHASFIGADVSSASFHGALAVSTDFNGVLGNKTVFSAAHIYGDGQAFDNARDLEGANFSQAVLAANVDTGGGFDFTGADLKDAHFDGSQCVGCNFTKAQLDRVTFSGAYVPGAVLAGASLTGAHLTDAWLYCGDRSNSRCDNVPGSTDRWLWPLALGSNENSGNIPFANTNLSGVSTSDVGECPDGHQPDPTNGCVGDRLLPANPTNAPKIPAACSAAALDSCPTPTATLFDATATGSPLAVAAAAPPTWATALTSRGYYVGLDDGTIRMVGDGPPQLVAGAPGQHCAAPTDPCGDGGPASQAHLGMPAGLAVGPDGSLYVADPALHRVRVIGPPPQQAKSQRARCRKPPARKRSARLPCAGGSRPLAAAASGTITTVAGNGTECTGQQPACGDGGAATDASLSGPYGVWVDPSGRLFIADGHRGVREVHPDGRITTVGGDTYDIRGVAGDSAGALYATTNDPDYVVKIDLAKGSVTKVVGTGTSGYNGNSDPNTGLLLPGTQVQINHPQGVSIGLDGNVVFADSGNNLIRAYVPSSSHVIDLGGLVSKGIPQGGFNDDRRFADATEFDHPLDVTVTRGVLFVVADTQNKRIREFGPIPDVGRIRVRGAGPACRNGTASTGTRAVQAAPNASTFRSGRPRRSSPAYRSRICARRVTTRRRPRRSRRISV
jgi:uncharacterized protein YjbI with pentapeptide repeats